MIARRESTKKAAQMEEKLTGERLAVLEVLLLAAAGVVAAARVADKSIDNRSTEERVVGWWLVVGRDECCSLCTGIYF